MLDSVRAMGQLLGETFGPATFGAAERRPAGGPEDAAEQRLDDLLRRTEERLRHGVPPLQLLGAAEAQGFLGYWGALRDLILVRGEPEVLRQALEKLGKDTSFERHTADDTYRALDVQTPDEVQFLLAGHTHLERSLPRSGGGHYYNSGTWVRLIQLTEDVLGSEKRFQPIHDAFTAGSLRALDAVDNLILRRPAVVSIVADDAGAGGELAHVVDGKLEAIDGTQSRGGGR
jgi:hypothetical protein